MGRPFLGFVLFFTALIGCSAESGPVSLPVPFTGSLTADTNIAYAIGAPLPDASASPSVKDQATVSTFPITWKTVCATDGSDAGDVTFLSTSEPEVRPFPDAGPDEVERIYTLSIRTTLPDGTELSSDDFQCFEFPTDYPVSDELQSFADTFPGATAQVRKAACSGHNTLNGELIDAKYYLGMVRLANGDFLYHTQQESPMFVNGVPFQQCGQIQDSRVVMTILYQGGSPLLPPQEPYLFSVTTPLSLPGSDQVVGTEILRFLTFVPSSDGSFIEATSDVQLLIGSSSLTIKNSRGLFHMIPELVDPIRNVLATDFADDPVITDTFLQGPNFVIFNSREETEATVINCNPDAHEATGIFQDLCVENGGLRAQLMCFVFGGPTGEGFTIEGAWVLLKP